MRLTFVKDLFGRGNRKEKLECCELTIFGCGQCLIGASEGYGDFSQAKIIWDKVFQFTYEQ